MSHSRRLRQPGPERLDRPGAIQLQVVELKVAVPVGLRACLRHHNDSLQQLAGQGTGSSGTASGTVDTGMCHWHCTGIQLEVTSRPPLTVGPRPRNPRCPGFGVILPRSRPNLEIDRRELPVNSDFPRAGLGQLEIGIIASGKSRRARIMSAQAANSKVRWRGGPRARARSGIGIGDFAGVSHGWSRA
jgi:hypothetical protein